MTQEKVNTVQKVLQHPISYGHTYWYFTIQNFLSEECTPDAGDSMKLILLINHLSPTIFSYSRVQKYLSVS